MKKLGLIPVGNRVIVDQDTLETTYGESGIVIQHENAAAEQASQIAGTVVAIGKDCWTAWSEDWCQVGDRVLFAKFSGKSINDVSTGRTYLVMNDIDIVAVIVPPSEDEDATRDSSNE